MDDFRDKSNEGSSEQWGNPPKENPISGAYPSGGRRSHARRRRKRAPFALIIACLLASSAFGFLGGYMSGQSQGAGPSSPSSPSAQTEVLYQSVVRMAVSGIESADGELTASEVAAVVKPSVVEITTETASWSGRMGQLISTGAGSGVVLTQDGYIVTNHHVVSGAQSVSVRLSNGDEYGATVVGMDSKTDLAVLKIDANGLTPAVLGTSETLIVGEDAVVVGNPLGELGGTVTKGIISALDREITIDNEAMTLMQTDAAVNPGNSGGGLFNLYGELIGVINAKSSGTDIEGIGFAIPIDTAKPVIEDLMGYGYVTGRIDTGLTLVDIQGTQSARRYRVNRTGLYISESKHADLKSGDRITAVGGTEIADMASFNAAMDAYSVGDVAEITVERNDRNATVNIALTEMTG